jgi:hypothetical protein
VRRAQIVIRLVLAAAILAGVVPASLAADCPAADRRPQVEIVIDDGSVAYDFSLTRAQMTDVPRQLGVAAPNHGRDPQGLTYNKLSFTVAAQLRYRDIRPGSRCVYPDRIVLTVSAEQRVFVDARYRDGSCERRAVLSHEDEHVRINRAAVHAHEKALRGAVAEVLAAHPFYLVPSSRPMQEVYIAPIQDRVKPVVKAIKDDAEKRHAILDSPASYDAVRDRCRNW